jgi:ABC-type uncharacterized transport system substrate-binding protein
VRRRKFITLLSAAATWPLTLHAQQHTIATIGYLSTRSPGEATYVTDAFIRGLNESDYVEGRNLAIEYRWAELQYDRLPALASDLVRRQVRVIAAVGGAHSGLAAKAVTSTIPIVFVTGYAWTRTQPEPPRGQRDRHKHDYLRVGPQTIGTSSPISAPNSRDRNARQSDESLH